jgi:chemotaxis protein MotA
MGTTNFVGIILCVIIFGASFLFGETRSMYFNAAAFALVLSGTVGAAFLGYPSKRIWAAMSVVRKTYFSKLPSEDDVVNALLDFALKSKYDGILSLEDETERSATLFLKDGLDMVVDGYSSEEIRDVLSTEMYFFKQRRDQYERVFRGLAKAAPSFGIIGSVIGLMEMLVGIGDVGVIIKTIPISLTATLYGILFSDFFFTPVAEAIFARTQAELFLKNLIVNGVIAINDEQDTYKLEKKLCSFLTASVRPVQEENFKEIRKQYFVLREQRKRKGAMPPTGAPR